MQLSITTDYARDTGNPEPYLCQIGEAGFTHVHWCHHWNTDFLYSAPEIDQIGRWLHASGLQLLDIHASDGVEKNWASLREYERLAGVELVRNRIDMAAALGADAIVMHLPDLGDPATQDQVWWQLRKSLDELEPHVRATHIRIALENTNTGSIDTLGRVFEHYGPEAVGLCYDCGHGNLMDNGWVPLEQWRDRLAVVHLHDNDGNGDQHNIPFSGTVDWARLAPLLATSAYRKPISLESNIHRTGIADEREFLARAYAAGVRLTGMVEQARAAA